MNNDDVTFKPNDVVLFTYDDGTIRSGIIERFSRSREYAEISDDILKVSWRVWVSTDSIIEKLSK